MKTSIIAAVAALIGSFAGAFFKEQIADWFSSSKKKKGIRSDLIKNVVQYFGYAKELISVNNANEYHITLLRKMQDYIKTAKEPEKSEIQKERDEVKVLTDKLSEVGSKIYPKVLECESNIVAITMEAEHYFQKHQYVQLRKTVKDIRHYTTSLEGKILKEYKDLPYNKITLYKLGQYEKSMISVYDDIEKQSMYYEDYINEILHIELFWKRKWFK